MIFPSRQPRSQQNHPMRGYRQPRTMAGPGTGARTTSNLLSGGGLSAITKSFGGKGIDSISKTLDGVQQMLNMVQSTAPLIQEYGPMVKNLPAMYRMAKAFKDIQSEDDGKQKTEADSTPDEGAEKPKETEKPAPPVREVKKEQKGPSRPKLYV